MTSALVSRNEEKHVKKQIGEQITLFVCAVLLLSGCATTGNPKDPIERFNRAVFGFNDALDQVVVRPVATGYDAVLPSPVKNRVANFFGNVADVLTSTQN